jgi:hypothetical protein
MDRFSKKANNRAFDSISLERFGSPLAYHERSEQLLDDGDGVCLFAITRRTKYKPVCFDQSV